MSDQTKPKEKATGAVGTLHQISGLVGVNTEKMHEKWKSARGVERREFQHSAELNRMLEEHEKQKKLKSADGGESVLTLNEKQSRILAEKLEAEKKKAEQKRLAQMPWLCPLVCRLVCFGPIIAALIYIGYTNLEKCPLADLPMWLMWLGIFWASWIGLLFLNYLASKVDSLRGKLPMNLINNAAWSIIASWCFYGLYLIWGNWSDYNDKDLTHPRYCEHSVMLFSKIVDIVFLIGFVFVAFVYCCYRCTVAGNAILEE